MTTGFAPVTFDAPLVNPSPNGLYASTQWKDLGADEAVRWLPSGVDVRVFNFGGEINVRVWEAPWNAAEADLTPADVKRGDGRPESPDPFLGLTIWSEDHCDPTPDSRAEVSVRVQQNLRLQEQLVVERAFAERVLADAGTPAAVTDVVDAVGVLEELFADTNTVGQIHAAARWASAAADRNQLSRNTALQAKSPLGHQWVFGGYGPALGATLVATSPTFGWRTPVVTRDGHNHDANEYTVVAERSVLVAYEQVIGAVTVGP